MQTLAQNGNGTAAYIDNLNEARKVLVEEASSTLFPIAKDVKIQVEFNPATVAEYRLIGYETRALAKEDFNNDAVDAGDIGAGHAVTAIYEITPVGGPVLVDPSRYAAAPKPAQETKADTQFGSEYAFLKMRYKLPDGDTSKLITTPITTADEKAASADVNWAIAVAGFGQILKGGQYMTGFGYDEAISMAEQARGADKSGYRAEFLNLARLAKTLAR
jgi:Ca-activated chloride channel family protein